MLTGQYSKLTITSSTHLARIVRDIKRTSLCNLISNFSLANNHTITNILVILIKANKITPNKITLKPDSKHTSTLNLLRDLAATLLIRTPNPLASTKMLHKRFRYFTNWCKRMATYRIFSKLLVGNCCSIKSVVSHRLMLSIKYSANCFRRSRRSNTSKCCKLSQCMILRSMPNSRKLPDSRLRNLLKLYSWREK